MLLKEAAHAEGASQRELAQHMGIEPPTLVRQLDKLAEDGLVERRPDPDDRRVVRVVVTPAGLERLQELHAVVHELDAELRGILTKRDVEVLSRALAAHQHLLRAARPRPHGDEGGVRCPSLTTW